MKTQTTKNTTHTPGPWTVAPGWIKEALAYLSATEGN